MVRKLKKTKKLDIENHLMFIPLKFQEIKDKEPVFFEEIARGITLWEAKE